MLQKSIAARLGRSVQCGVKLDGGWAYTGSAYTAKSDNNDVAFCGKYANGISIEESSFQEVCSSYSTLCIMGNNSNNKCVKDALKSVVESYSGFCENDYFIFVSNSRPAYNGYTGQIERVDGNGDYICTLMCGGY